MFDYAINARLPIIRVQTTDLVNVVTVLEYYTQGKKVFGYEQGRKVQPNTFYCYNATHKDLLGIEALYAEFSAAESSLIVINGGPDSAFYEAGSLPIPRDLIYEFLSEYMSDNMIGQILPNLGGLNLKEITEIIMITQAKYGDVASEHISLTRQAYQPMGQGLEVVQTDIRGYKPESYLEKIAENYKELFIGDYDYRLRSRGLMAYGAAGTGKSMGAKYLAKEWGVPLYRLDTTIQSKYVGSSEENLSNALKKIEQEAPCILLIDEVEKMFSQSDDSGVTQKLLASLLWWLQEHRAKVFTYMTCNDLDKVPVELYRFGRISHSYEFKKLNDEAQVRSLMYTILDSYDHALADPTKDRLLKDIQRSMPISPADINKLIISYIIADMQIHGLSSENND